MRQQGHFAGLGELHELRRNGRLVLEPVETGAGDFAVFEHPAKRVFVDDLAARGVVHYGIGAQIFEAARREQVIGRRRVWAIDRNDVHARQHLVERIPIRMPRAASSIGEAHAGDDYDNESIDRRPWRAAPMLPGRCGPCRRCRAVCRGYAGRASKSATSRSIHRPGSTLAAASTRRRATARISAMVIVVAAVYLRSKRRAYW